MSEYGLTRLNGDAGPKRTREPTAPIAALSRFTATRASVVVEPAVAMPPPSTSPPFAFASSRATRLMLSAGTPDAVAAAAMSAERMAARSVLASAPAACNPSSRVAFSIAEGRRASVPGARALKSLVEEDLQHREAQQALGAGRVAQPLVGVGRGQGQARLHRHEGALLALEEGVHPREVPGVAFAVQPGLEKIGAERYQVGRVADRVVGNRVASERHSAGRAQRLVAARLRRDAGARAHTTDAV